MSNNPRTIRESESLCKVIDWCDRQRTIECISRLSNSTPTGRVYSHGVDEGLRIAAMYCRRLLGYSYDLPLEVPKKSRGVE